MKNKYDELPSSIKYSDDDYIHLEPIKKFDRKINVKDPVFLKIMCQLTHSTIPTMTGKKIVDPITGEWVWEIKYVCKEGCNHDK